MSQEAKPGSGEDALTRLARWGTAAENVVLVFLFTGLMLLAVAQIFLRIFFDTGFIWNDELQKFIVLWITLVASIAASRSNRHLRIDIVGQFVPERYARLPRAVVDTFAFGVCSVLAWQSWRYIVLTREFEDTVITGLDLPAWLAYGVMPVAFAIMAYRFLIAAIGEMRVMLEPKAS